MATAVAGVAAREGTAKATVADQISQAVQSTSNLLHLMQESSPSQALLMKLPKNLLAKAPTIKNTGQVLEQMPRVISQLDAHMENGLQSCFQTWKAASLALLLRLIALRRNLHEQKNMWEQHAEGGRWWDTYREAMATLDYYSIDAGSGGR